MSLVVCFGGVLTNCMVLFCVYQGLNFWYRERGGSSIGYAVNSLSWIAFHVQLMYRVYQLYIFWLFDLKTLFTYTL